MPPRSDPPPCPQADKHTPCPDSYMAWHHWAARKARTHTQIRCDGCGLFTIWVPKSPTGAGANA